MRDRKDMVNDPSVREKALALVKEAVGSSAGAAAGVLVAGASGATPAVMAVTGAATMVPYFLTTLLGAFSIARTWKERDAQQLWSKILLGSGKAEDATPEEIAGIIVSHENEPYVHETIYRSVRSLLDAADPVVTVPLGLLAREYIGTEKKPDAFFRGFAQLLTMLSADGYQGLQRLMHSVSASDFPDQEIRVLVDDGTHGKHGFGFYLHRTEKGEEIMPFAGTCEDPGYVLHALKTNRLAREVPGLFGDAPADNALVRRSVAAQLCRYFQ